MSVFLYLGAKVKAEVTSAYYLRRGSLNEIELANRHSRKLLCHCCIYPINSHFTAHIFTVRNWKPLELTFQSVLNIHGTSHSRAVKSVKRAGTYDMQHSMCAVDMNQTFSVL